MEKGDLVYLDFNKVSEEDKKNNINPDMYKYFNSTYTIENKEYDKIYKLNNAGEYLYKEDWLTLVSDDPVNKPKHYMLFPDKDIEVIDVVDVLIDKAASILNPRQLSYYTHLLGYIFRFAEKNGEEDLKKAKFYLDRIINNF